MKFNDNYFSSSCYILIKAESIKYFSVWQMKPARCFAALYDCCELALKLHVTVLNRLVSIAIQLHSSLIVESYPTRIRQRKSRNCVIPQKPTSC